MTRLCFLVIAQMSLKAAVKMTRARCATLTGTREVLFWTGNRITPPYHEGFKQIRVVSGLKPPISNLSSDLKQLILPETPHRLDKNSSNYKTTKFNAMSLAVSNSRFARQRLDEDLHATNPNTRPLRALRDHRAPETTARFRVLPKKLLLQCHDAEHNFGSSLRLWRQRCPPSFELVTNKCPQVHHAFLVQRFGERVAHIRVAWFLLQAMVSLLYTLLTHR